MMLTYIRNVKGLQENNTALCSHIQTTKSADLYFAKP